MRKLLLTLLMACIGTAGYAQKKKVTFDKETGEISVNETAYALLEKENAPGQLGINKNFTIKNLEGEELLYFVFTQEPEVNPNGYKTGKTLTYYTLNFIKSGEQGRRPGTMTAKGAARMVAKGNLIQNGDIDASARTKFLLKYR